MDVWLTPRFQALLDIKHAGAAAEGATPLEPPFLEAFPAGLFTAKPDFDAALQAEEALSLEGLGEVVAEAETSEGTTIIVTAAPLGGEATHPAAAALHARLSPLLFFFVDAASAIDAEDPAWTVLLSLERSPDGLEVVSLGRGSGGAHRDSGQLRAPWNKPPRYASNVHAAPLPPLRRSSASRLSTPCTPTQTAAASASPRSWCCRPTRAAAWAAPCCRGSTPWQSSAGQWTSG